MAVESASARRDAMSREADEKVGVRIDDQLLELVIAMFIREDNNVNNLR